MFDVKLISDAGYQEEIASVASATQQVEVFLRVLKTSLLALIDTRDPASLRKQLDEFLVLIYLILNTLVYWVTQFSPFFLVANKFLI